MQTEERQRQSSVVGGLITEPHRFQFIQAVRLVLRWLGRHGIPAEQVWSQVLRFENNVAPGFPASEIQSVHLTGVHDWREIPQLLQRQGSVRIQIAPNVIGLLGVGGALPAIYTDRVTRGTDRSSNAAAQAFINLLSHRLVALYCQAWDKHRLEHADGDKQLQLLRSLAGLPLQAPTTKNPLRETGAFYAALLRTRPVSASAIANILAGYFGVAVTVQQFIGGWDAIPASMRSILGTAPPRLGHGACLGQRIWRQDRRLRLVFGELNLTELRQFLPSGEASAALGQLLTLFAAPGLIYELRLLLAADCVTPLVLGRKQRLGWETFLQQKDRPILRKHIGYRIAPTTLATAQSETAAR